MKQAILLINGVPYTFPEGFIESEEYGIANSIQLPIKEDEPPIITPGFRTANITISIPLGEWKNRLAYKATKETIRITQFAFAQAPHRDGQNNKLTIPFTKLQVPWEIQISCAYIGINVQLACCILSSFTVSSTPNSSSVETWQIGLTEYDISQLRGKPKQDKSKSKTTDSTNTFIGVTF